MKRIGLFDSGVGGLSVLKELLPAFPRAQFVYFGDTARLPYGNRSRQEISTFVQEIIGFLAEVDLDVLVVACNTSFALAQDAILKCSAATEIEVFNLVQPLARRVADSDFSRIGVLATSATAKSGAFAKALEALNFDGKIMEIGCPRLVPLIESRRLGEAEIEAALSFALQDYLQKMAGAQAIVLGCTHFPFLRARVQALIEGPLQASFPGSVSIIDPAPVLAQQMLAQQMLAQQMLAQQMLAQQMLALSEAALAPDMVHVSGRELPAYTNVDRSVEIFTTGDPDAFRATASLCLGEDFFRNIKSVRRISVSALVESERERKARMVTRSGSFPPILLKPAIAPAGFFA